MRLFANRTPLRTFARQRESDGRSGAECPFARRHSREGGNPCSQPAGPLAIHVVAELQVQSKLVGPGHAAGEIAHLSL